MDKVNFVLIDYENVQPTDVQLLVEHGFKIRIFVGAKQKNVLIDTAMALQPVGSDAEYIRIKGSGRDALDFHIAYYIGKLSVENPGAYFHIISDDKGFDPLTQHLKDTKIRCVRRSTLKEIPPIALAIKKLTAIRVDEIIDHLKKFKSNAPKTINKLSSMISSKFSKTLADHEVNELISILRQKRVITEVAGKIEISLE